MRWLIFFLKLIAIILLVWIVTYFLVRELTPDPGVALSGLYTDAATRQYVIAEMALNEPWLTALGKQLVRLARLDFGISLRTQRPVLTEIADPFLLTFSLATMVTTLATLLAVASFALGLLRKISIKISLTLLISALSAFPGFLIALLLSSFFPAYGASESDSINWAPLLLPSLALLLPLAPYAASTGLQLAQDMRQLPWFETFTAFGFAPSYIAWTRGRRWLLRGLCNIVITVFLAAFTGSVAVELVCGLPGLGATVLDAIDMRDLPVVLTVSGLTATFAGAMVLIREIMVKNDA